MKHLCVASLLALISLQSAATDVGVSISIGQPGFYGRIEIGDTGPRPQLIYAKPVLIESVRMPPPPLYLRVRPGHEKNWRKHCHRYDACGRPVYFVRSDWYERNYVPYYRDHWDRDQGRWRDDDRRDDRRHERRDERRDDRRDEDRGPGKGRGHGHEHGRGHER